MCNYWKAVTPGCYDQLTVLRDVAREKMGVNTEFELPLAITITYLEQEQHYSRIESVRRASDLTACYIWRKHKIIYDFDDVLAEELCSQADAFEEDYTLPINIILRPPYPCVFIKSSIPTKNFGNFTGFWVWIEVDAETNVKEFRVLFTTEDFELTHSTVLELTKPTIGDCIEDTNRTRRRNHPDLYLEDELRLYNINDKMLLRAMQLYLYICSAEADVRDNLEQKKIYRPRAEGQPVKDRFRELEIKDVGVVIGATLRRAQREAEPREAVQHSNIEPHERKQGSPRRPHTRRAHWHHYWTGAKNQPDERKLTLKWIHPILVGGYTDTVVTMIPVKE